ncbi:MAG: hypothetical protein RL188_448 [Bacteroidota bacterium]|jgi:putative endonuclease
MFTHNKDTGFFGENMAADYLINNGFQVLHRNWRHRHLEIDLIACKGNCLHIVEVKTRHTKQFGYPEQHIKAKKMKLLRNGAALYQYQHPYWKIIQFDIIAIQLNASQKWALFYIEDVYF